MKLEIEFRFLCENIMHPRNTIYFFPDTYCFSVTFSVFSSSLTTTDFVGLSSFCSTLCSVVTSEIVSLIFILLAKMDYNNLITAFFLKLQSIAFINITRKKSVAFRNSTFLFKIRKCLLANFSCFISQNGIYEKSWETGAVLTEDLNAKAIVNDHKHRFLCFLRVYQAMQGSNHIQVVNSMQCASSSRHQRKCRKQMLYISLMDHYKWN